MLVTITINLNILEKIFKIDLTNNQCSIKSEKVETFDSKYRYLFGVYGDAFDFARKSQDTAVATAHVYAFSSRLRRTLFDRNKNSHARAWKALHPRPDIRPFGYIVRVQRRASKWKRTAYIHWQCWFFTTHGRIQNEKMTRI